MIVKDDGVGFDLSASKKYSNGLNNMQSRCDKIHAKLVIKSNISSGTEVEIIGSLVGV